MPAGSHTRTGGSTPAGGLVLKKANPRTFKTSHRKPQMSHGSRIFATSTRKGYIFYWQPAQARKTVP
jgi:hypothetical protein